MFSLTISLLLITNVAFATSRLADLHGRIVGGRGTEIESHPYQVSLKKYGSHECGAIIISEDHVLTAGHCVSGVEAKVLTIRAGSTFFNSGGSIHQVESIKVHEDYKYQYTLFNDIAVLRISPPFELDQTRQPVKLYENGEKVKTGEYAVVTGWGSVYGTKPRLPKQLQMIRIPITSIEFCKKAHKNYGGVSEGQFCAGFAQGGKDACSGDGGGPLVIEGRLAGIVSSGTGCAEQFLPGIYTEVAYYREWIRKNTGV